VNFITKIWLRVEMRLTQTNEIGDLINSINNIQINGNADVMTAVKVAQLALKHRMNKSQRQRIIVFVGHPMTKGTEEDFEDLGMRLKKNNVSIDVINFANPDNVARLQALVNAANGSEDQPTCHFLDVPLGCSHITDVMITSPILQPEDSGMGAGAGDIGAGNAGGANSDDPFANLGFDPNMDPELAMAIRLSMEEAKQAEQAANPQPASAEQ
jgi:26S proteasome regulatory subunit N10